jgi:hypothetical protein
MRGDMVYPLRRPGVVGLNRRTAERKYRVFECGENRLSRAASSTICGLENSRADD